MIEINGIYKLKHIKGLKSNSTNDFKVIAMSEDKQMVQCEVLNGDDAGEQYVFMTQCLIDPDKPEDIYCGELIRKD